MIELIDPPHQLVMRTEPEPPATPEVTAYTLRAENGGTRATITETGYEALPADQRQQWADAASQGYALSLEQLKGLLEGS
ncbi:MAG TPA: SRPBCC domain-containing protein [Roseiflexaceae bacterium]|nr:SRPBCC domain-containing protein [Roseiflexaceae bacterium]